LRDMHGDRNRGGEKSYPHKAKKKKGWKRGGKRGGGGNRIYASVDGREYRKTKQ